MSKFEKMLERQKLIDRLEDIFALVDRLSSDVSKGRETLSVNNDLTTIQNKLSSLHSEVNHPLIEYKRHLDALQIDNLKRAARGELIGE